MDTEKNAGLPTRPCPLCAKGFHLREIPCPVCKGAGKVPRGEEAQRFRGARQGILNMLTRLSREYEDPERSLLRESLLEALEDLFLMDGGLEKAVEELLRREDGV